MPKSSVNASLSSYDDIFSTEESRQEEQREQVRQIPIGELFPCRPFRTDFRFHSEHVLPFLYFQPDLSQRFPLISFYQWNFSLHKGTNISFVSPMLS